MKKLLMLLVAVPLLVSCVTLTVQAKEILLRPENTVNLRGEVTRRSANEWQNKLFKLVQQRGSKTYPIYLVLDTPGGDVEAGLEFIEFASTMPNVETITLKAASMGSGIVEHMPGPRHITAGGTLMFHRARVTLSGQVADGELESRLKYVKDMVNVMESKNATRMSISLDSYKEAVKDELWLVGQGAVDKKAADDIVTLKCSLELLTAVEVSQTQVFMFIVNSKVSACPIMRGPLSTKEDEEPEE